MKLFRFGSPGRERPGAVDAQGVARDLSSVCDDLAGGALSRANLERIRRTDLQSLPRVPSTERLGPCVGGTRNFIAVGLNYADHAAETGAAVPKEPVLFNKAPSCIVGPNDQIVIPRGSRKTDWEVELAVIIGTTCRRVGESEALKNVFGYSVFIDISARDCRRAGQWIYSKGQDSYGPFGPCIVTADEIADPHALDLWLSVNGTLKQKSNTRHMLFKIPQLIADISAGMTLEPGDIIATGTPSGVGAGRKPQEWLWPGDVIEAGVQHIGQIRHPVVAV